MTRHSSGSGALRQERCRFPRWNVFLAALAIAVVAAAGAASPALSDSTQVSVVRIDVTDTVSGLCGFDITEHQTGSLRVTDFFNRNGLIVKTIVTPVDGTFVTTWTANGATATSHGTPVLIIDPNADTEANVGVVEQFVVPGYGVVFGQTGRIVFGDQGIVFQAGENQLVTGDAAALCAALS